MLSADDKPLFAWWTTAHTGALLLVGTAILMVRLQIVEMITFVAYFAHTVYSLFAGKINFIEYILKVHYFNMNNDMLLINN